MKKYNRKYEGVIITADNYREILEKEGREGIAFHNKHLKAYKRGRNYFQHGKDVDGYPLLHPVLSKINLENSN